MANGQFKFGKPSGGVTTVSITDGASNTNLVLPESGTVATTAYADEKTTLAEVKSEISTGSNLVTSPTGTIGYSTGAGGTVTQLTSKSTTVTLNKPTGRINMNNAALAAGATVSFAVNNSLYSTVDLVLLLLAGGYSGTGANYNIWVAGNTNGQFYINVKNISTGSLSEGIVLEFNLVKGATA